MAKKDLGTDLRKARAMVLRVAATTATEKGMKEAHNAVLKAVHALEDAETALELQEVAPAKQMAAK